MYACYVCYGYIMADAYTAMSASCAGRKRLRLYNIQLKYQYNDRRSGPPASPPVSFNIHKYKSIPYHYTLLTCVTVVVRTTTVLTRPHTHSLNTTLQKTRRTLHPDILHALPAVLPPQMSV